MDDRDRERRMDRVVARALAIIAEGPENPDAACVALVGMAEAYNLLCQCDGVWTDALRLAAYRVAERETV